MQEQIHPEVESLKIQVSLLESELEISRMRAESAEEELRQLKATIRLSARITAVDSATSTYDDAKEIPTAPPLPPPPPPMPTNLLNSAQTNNAFRSRSNSQTLNDAISSAQQTLHQTSELKKAKKATGRELKFFFSIHTSPVLASIPCSSIRGKFLSLGVYYKPKMLIISERERCSLRVR